MKITTDLPSQIKAFSYVKNHHYVALEDTEGNKTQLNASGVLIGDCVECKAKCLALSHSGNMTCTHCGGAVKWAWNKPQLAFIPEHESTFMGFAAKKDGES